MKRSILTLGLFSMSLILMACGEVSTEGSTELTNSESSGLELVDLSVVSLATDPSCGEGLVSEYSFSYWGVDNGGNRKARDRVSGVDNGGNRRATDQSSGVDNGGNRKAPDQGWGVDNGGNRKILDPNDSYDSQDSKFSVASDGSISSSSENACNSYGVSAVLSCDTCSLDQEISVSIDGQSYFLNLDADGLASLQFEVTDLVVPVLEFSVLGAEESLLLEITPVK